MFSIMKRRCSSIAFLLDLYDPVHVDDLFVKLTREDVGSVIVILHVGVEVVRGKVCSEVLLHVFIATVVLIKIFQNKITSYSLMKSLLGCRNMIFSIPQAKYLS